MNDWLSTAMTLVENGESAVLVTVIATRGSAPRDAGTRMIVCRDLCHGTIGGGHLEYKAIALAREQLQSHAKAQLNVATNNSMPGKTEDTALCRDAVLRRFPLGASLGQCCGGLVQLLFEPLNRQAGSWLQYLRNRQDAGQSVVIVTQAVRETCENGRVVAIHKQLVSQDDALGTLQGDQQEALQHARRMLSEFDLPARFPDPMLWFECVSPSDFRILLFGAGHIGKALVNVCAELPCYIRWVDSRAHEFPGTLPDNVQAIVTEDPESELDDAPAGSYVLIMTHNHALDESICARALQNDTLAWCGLIGSASKRRRFIQRFRARGLDDTSLQRLTCPVGVPGITGKHPAEIAVSVAAQILGHRQQQSRCTLPVPPVSELEYA